MSTFLPLSAPAAESPAARSIPFDYSFEFDLLGEPGKVWNKTVAVSIEGPFTAVSIGYGVLAELPPIPFGPSLKDELGGDRLPLSFKPSTEVPIRLVPLGALLSSFDRALRVRGRTIPGEPDGLAVLRNGIRLNPRLAEVGLRAFQTGRIRSDFLEELFMAVGAPPGRVQFKYALFDEGSGRAFQSDPLLNTAGLGSADGDRPFRYFARPILFAPRSNIRLEITEVTEFPGRLFVSLHGSKTLGGSDSPTGRARPRRRRGR